MAQQATDRHVFSDIDARNETEVIDNIYDRAIITHNSANILNIMAEVAALNPEEEVIRKRGRKRTPKLSQLPLRRSPRKSANPSGDGVRPLFDSHSSATTTQSEQTHDYFLRTPKKTPQKSSATTPSKTPSKSASMTGRRVSPRKRLQLDNNDSGLGLSPALSGSETTPTMSSSERKATVPKAKTSSKSLTMTRRRRRRYF